jgi:hypothetical protein
VTLPTWREVLGPSGGIDAATVTRPDCSAPPTAATRHEDPEMMLTRALEDVQDRKGRRLVGRDGATIGTIDVDDRTDS